MNDSSGLEPSDDSLRTARYEGHIVYALYARIPGGHHGCVEEESQVCVYVGVTSHFTQRMRQHSKKWWWRAIHQQDTELQRFDTRAEAEAMEKRMIRWNQPSMNRAGRLLLVG